MLKRIKVCGYKSLVDVDIDLHPLSVLLGPNASGKSNFLDALQLLSRIATRQTLKEAFEPPYRGKPLESFTFGSRGIRGLLGQETASFSIEADVSLSDSVLEAVNRQVREMKQSGTSSELDRSGKNHILVRERNLRYRVEIEILPKSGILRVTDEFLGALTRDGRIQGKRKLFLEKEKEHLHLRIEGQSRPIYYERYLDHSILSKPLYPPHHPHLVAFRKELASWNFFYLEPREKMRAASEVKEVRHIGLMGEELASFLNTLKALDPPQFKAVEKALKMIIPKASGIDVGPNDLGEVELNLMEGDVPVPARVLSEGTLRVLGLLALGGAKESPSVLGFEEPENGIHPRRLRMIADLLKNRAAMGNTQLIITTHSPVLPDMFDDENLFVCRKEDRRTEIEHFSTWGVMGRRAVIDKVLDAEDTERTPVSERILRGDFDG